MALSSEVPWRFVARRTAVLSRGRHIVGASYCFICNFFNFICHNAPPRQVWGSDPRYALCRNPPPPPPTPAAAKRLWYHTAISDNSKSFHQILCSPLVAHPRRRGGHARDQWERLIHGWSMVGSEQHLKYTPYLRGVWPQRWKWAAARTSSSELLKGTISRAIKERRLLLRCEPWVALLLISYISSEMRRS
jgi:hypothetical protein